VYETSLGSILIRTSWSWRAARADAKVISEGMTDSWCSLAVVSKTGEFVSLKQ